MTETDGNAHLPLRGKGHKQQREIHTFSLDAIIGDGGTIRALELDGVLGISVAYIKLHPVRRTQKISLSTKM